MLSVVMLVVFECLVPAGRSSAGLLHCMLLQSAFAKDSLQPFALPVIFLQLFFPLTLRSRFPRKARCLSPLDFCFQVAWGAQDKICKPVSDGLLGAN
jgi:hypothetical protein